MANQIITVSSMCRKLCMSRSQFYWHSKRGTFHAPLRLPNGRPYFDTEMVEQNVAARNTGIGVNGEYVLFYERQPSTEKKPTATPKHDKLIVGLKSLGLSAITSDQIETAMKACYPNGTEEADETAVLRTVFRHLKRSSAV